MTQDDVYFNAKAAFEQRMQDIAAKAEADEEEKEKQQTIMTGAAALGFLVGMLCYPVILLLLWNWLMPGLFGFATIGYFKAAALIIIGRILFKHD